MNYNLEHKVAQNSILPFFSFDLAYCCLLQCSKLSKKSTDNVCQGYTCENYGDFWFGAHGS